METQEQLTETIKALSNQVTKIGGETRSLLTKIEDLLGKIGSEVSEDLKAAVLVLKEQVDIVDNLVPDAVEDEPEGETEGEPEGESDDETEGEKPQGEGDE